MSDDGAKKNSFLSFIYIHRWGLGNSGAGGPSFLSFFPFLSSSFSYFLWRHSFGLVIFLRFGVKKVLFLTREFLLILVTFAVFH